MHIIPAHLDHAQLLFEWRNDPVTRTMSKNQEPVPWENHVVWLTARLARESPNLFVAIVDGRTVGTFRVDDAEISYTVAPDSRGRGLGHEMLSMAREMFGPLVAEIYERNAASIKIASRAGMVVKILAD